MKNIKINFDIVIIFLTTMFTIYFYGVVNNLQIMFTILVSGFSFLMIGTLIKLCKRKREDIINLINVYIIDELNSERREDHKNISLAIYKEHNVLVKYIFFMALICTNLILMLAHLAGIYNYFLFSIFN